MRVVLKVIFVIVSGIAVFSSVSADSAVAITDSTTITVNSIVNSGGQASAPAGNTLTTAAEYESSADVIWTQIHNIKDANLAMELSETTINYYRKAIDLQVALGKKDDMLFYKYVKAIIMKYNYLVLDSDQKAQKQKIYSDSLALLSRVYPDDTKNSIYIKFCRTMLWIQNVEFYNVFQAATGGVADKIRNYALDVYNENKAFENYYSGAIIGRIYYLAPNIPFLLTWPDKNVSKKYLQEAILKNPAALMAKLFLADTLYDLGEKDKALDYYHYVMSTDVRADFYFEDLKIKRDCIARMKQLGIK